MDLNQGRFLQNGQCGYILKPTFMCRPSTTFHPENVGGGPGHNPLLLTIRVRQHPLAETQVKQVEMQVLESNFPEPFISSSSSSFSQVISAQQLPKPGGDKPSSIVDPQVWVEIHGAPIDNSKKKTNHVDNNGKDLEVPGPGNQLIKQ